MAKQIEAEAVNKFMAFLPDEMNKDEGRNFMTLLYKIGFLSEYLDALDAADENGYDENGMKKSFSYDFENNINIDPQTGRITYINLFQTNYLIDDDDDDDDDDDNNKMKMKDDGEGDEKDSGCSSLIEAILNATRVVENESFALNNTDDGNGSDNGYENNVDDDDHGHDDNNDHDHDHDHDDDNDDEDDDGGGDWNEGEDEDEVNYPPFELPFIIEHFKSLESIRLYKCHKLPIIELGKLPLLKKIVFDECHRSLFECIPVGLRLPSSTKIVSSFFLSDSYFSLLPFLKILPDKLEVLSLSGIRTRDKGKTSKQMDEILRLLKNDDLIFSQSLTTINMTDCELNEDGLELLLFEILPNFPNLHSLIVTSNNIKSLMGIEARIKRLSSSVAAALPLTSSSSLSSSRTKLQNNNILCKICLLANPVVDDVIIKTNASIDPKEKAAVLTLLNTFDRISNLGVSPYWNRDSGKEYNNYNQDIEYLLRRNQVNMKCITPTITTTEGETISGGRSNTIPINRSLWPLIFERAYQKSEEIYWFASCYTQEDKNRQKCATGLFELVRNGPFFAGDHQRRCHDDSNPNDIINSTTTITDFGCGNDNDNALKRKRNTYSL